MKVISIINHKGGVAKTITAINMAEILCRRHGKHILLLDNDPQGNASKFYDRYYPDIIPGSAAILYSKNEYVVPTRTSGVDLVTSNPHLTTAVDALAASWEEGQHLLYDNFIKRRGHDYDYIIIDNPPAMGLNVINSLVAADDVIVPVKLDSWALDGLDFINDQIDAAREYNSHINLACLITAYRRTAVQEEGEAWLRKNYPAFNTKIRYSAKVEETTYTQMGIAEYSRRSYAAIDYIRWVKEYLQGGGMQDGRV